MRTLGLMLATTVLTLTGTAHTQEYNRDNYWHVESGFGRCSVSRRLEYIPVTDSYVRDRVTVGVGDEEENGVFKKVAYVSLELSDVLELQILIPALKGCEESIKLRVEQQRQQRQSIPTK